MSRTSFSSRLRTFRLRETSAQCCGLNLERPFFLLLVLEVSITKLQSPRTFNPAVFLRSLTSPTPLGSLYSTRFAALLFCVSHFRCRACSEHYHFRPLIATSPCISSELQCIKSFVRTHSNASAVLVIFSISKSAAFIELITVRDITALVDMVAG